MLTLPLIDLPLLLLMLGLILVLARVAGVSIAAARGEHFEAVVEAGQLQATSNSTGRTLCATLRRSSLARVCLPDRVTAPGDHARQADRLPAVCPSATHHPFQRAIHTIR